MIASAKVSFERNAFKQTPDHVENLVGIQFLPHPFELVEQRLDDTALPSLGGHQVEDNNRVVLLFVPVDAAHALLQAAGFQWDVVVHHQPAELEADSFTCGVRSNHVGPRHLLVQASAEKLDLLFATLIGHAYVDLRHLACIVMRPQDIGREG